MTCGGEPEAGIPEVRERLESAYGTRVFDAGTGFGFSCDYPEYRGMHWTADDLAYYELVDPDTREPVPLEDGAQGEALFTMLEGDGMAWLRTSLGDVHQVFTYPCPCGKPASATASWGAPTTCSRSRGSSSTPPRWRGWCHRSCPRLPGSGASCSPRSRHGWSRPSR